MVGVITQPFSIYKDTKEECTFKLLLYSPALKSVRLIYVILKGLQGMVTC